jgi:peptidoglycan/LPS O-acetylase OafA/YrhL
MVGRGVSIDEAEAATEVIPVVTDVVEKKPTRRNRFVFLDLIRSVAAPLVFYSHVVEYWNKHGHSSPVTDSISTFVNNPLSLFQDFGFFGVALFFLVSGFVVTHRASQERATEFALKRVLRIYPVLFAVVALIGVFGGGLHLLGAANLPTFTPTNLVTNALLINYFLLPQVVLILVAWTLAIEVMFYLLLLILLPLIKRITWVALSIELALCWCAVEFARDFGGNFFLIAVSLSFLPVLLLGQICWAVWNKRLQFRYGALMGIAAWLIFVWAGNRDMGRLDHGYDSAVCIALLLFVGLLLAEDHLRPTRAISYLADRSYSIYLIHWFVALPVMADLYPHVPAWLAIIAAIAATLGVVELSYRGIERPSQRLARYLTRKSR